MIFQRIIKEPLVQFLAIALIVYWFQGVLGSGEAQQRTMSLSAEEMLQIKAVWSERLERELRSTELDAAMRKQLHDNMLFEEALHLGLHREDKAIYETLVRRVKQLLQTPTLPHKIEDDLLYRYYQEHLDNYRQKALTSFVHVFVSIEHRHPFKLANAILELLEAGNVSDHDISRFGDKIVSNDTGEATQQRIETEFGKSFYTELSRLKIGVWSGPLISNAGIHLVKVKSRHGGEVIPYETIKDIVVSDYIDDIKRQHYQKKLWHIRAQHGILKEPE